MLVSDYLRPTAKKAGIDAPPRTFGFHTFRRTLASVLVGNKVDPKVVQSARHHQGIVPKLELYAKAITSNKLDAQDIFLDKLFAHKLDELSRVEEKVLLEDMPVGTGVLQ